MPQPAVEPTPGGAPGSMDSFSPVSEAYSYRAPFDFCDGGPPGSGGIGRLRMDGPDGARQLEVGAAAGARVAITRARRPG